MKYLLLLLSIVVVGASAAIIRCGSNNCGGFGCDFGPNDLNLAINATKDGDTLLLYGSIFVNNVKPTPIGFDDTLYTILDSITIRGVPSDDVFKTLPALVINSPGTKGLNLFTLATEGIRLLNFTINRNFVNNKDNHPDVATIRFRSCFNGTCFFPVRDITVSNIAMQLGDSPFLGTDVYFENGTFSDISIQRCTFSAQTGVNIVNTSLVTDIEINRNRFLWAAYNNNNENAKNEVDVSRNFWRPCPYRGPGLIRPKLGVQPDDLWLPYCVSFNCTFPGPIATPDGMGGYDGWTSIQDALTSSESDTLEVAVTAPYFMINTSQIIYRRIMLTSFVEACETACFANGTWPTVVISNVGDTSATIGFVVLGNLMSMSNIQFELEPLTRLAVYRQEIPYDEAEFTAKRGALAFGDIAFTNNALVSAALNVSLTSNFSMFNVRSGGDMIINNIQVVEGRQALLFWGPNKNENQLDTELLMEDCLFDVQANFAVYMAGPVITMRLESNYMGNTTYGLLAEKMSDMDILRTQLIALGTGVTLSEVTETILDCNACVDVTTVCIAVMTDSNSNSASWNTFAVPNSRRFDRSPDNDDTLDIVESVNLGKITPLSRVFQEFSAHNFPFMFRGSPMFTSSQDILKKHAANSTENDQQSAASALILKSTYLEYVNLECFSYRDTLSNVYTAYSNVRDECLIHDLKWDPFDNTTLKCNQLSPIVQKIPDFTWERVGSSMKSGQDCILTAKNTTEDVRFAVGTRSMRNAVVCAACDNDEKPFQNKTCDFIVGTFQEAMEQVRISQLEDAIIYVNGICYVFDEDIDVEGLTIENCGEAILSPTEGPLGLAKKVSAGPEADYLLRITVNDTTIEGIIFEVIGGNVTYLDDYCIIFIDGSLLPIFNTTLHNNTFLQENVDQLCTLMDTYTTVTENHFRKPRVGVKMNADSNSVVPEVSGVNTYINNVFNDGEIHIFYEFAKDIRQATPPYSRLHIIRNEFSYPTDAGVDILGIAGRSTRQDLFLQQNEYTNPTPDSSACDSGNTDPTICCEDTKGCTSVAQRFVDSEDALFDNERYNGGAAVQMAGRNILMIDARFRDKSSIDVGNDNIALLQNPYTPKNITMNGAKFAEDATLVCNLGKSFNPRTQTQNRLQVLNTIINGENIGSDKDDCGNTLVGILTANCFNLDGDQIYSSRDTAAFSADQFIDPDTRVRMNCTYPLVYIPSQQGGKGSCNCEYLPDDQFIKVLLIPDVDGLGQNEGANSDVANCPTGQIHDPNNRTVCIDAHTATPTPTSSPTPTPTHTPTTTTRHDSSSSSGNGVHHLWWLWAILCGIFVIIIIALVAWAGTAWYRRRKKKVKVDEPANPQSTPLNENVQTTYVGNSTNNYGGASLRW